MKNLSEAELLFLQMVLDLHPYPVWKTDSVCARVRECVW